MPNAHLRAQKKAARWRVRVRAAWRRRKRGSFQKRSGDRFVIELFRVSPTPFFVAPIRGDIKFHNLFFTLVRTLYNNCCPSSFMFRVRTLGWLNKARATGRPAARWVIEEAGGPGLFPKFLGSQGRF